MSPSRLLEDAGGIAIDFEDLGVDFLEFLGVVILLVADRAHLLPHVAADRTQDLDVLVPGTGRTLGAASGSGAD